VTPFAIAMEEMYGRLRTTERTATSLMMMTR